MPSTAIDRVHAMATKQKTLDKIEFLHANNTPITPLPVDDAPDDGSTGSGGVAGSNGANSVASSNHASTIDPSDSEDCNADPNVFTDALNGDESDDDDDNDHPIIHEEDAYASDGNNSNATALEGVDEDDGAIEGVIIKDPSADGALEGVGVEATTPTQ